MRPSLRYVLGLLFAVGVGCSGGQRSASFEGAVDVGRTQAELIILGERDESAAEYAWASYGDSSLTFEMGRGEAYHHLDLWTPHGAPLGRAAGTSYLDGPEVNGRGTSDDRVIAEGPNWGTYDDASPAVWVDLMYCPSAELHSCEMALATNVTFEATDDHGLVRVRYESKLWGDRTIRGTFLTPEKPQDATNDYAPRL